RITIVDTIADNASSAMAVVGDGREVGDLDLAALEVTLVVGDETVSGSGSAVLGHPGEAVAWLGNTLADYGESLTAGLLVLPGAVARAIPVSSGPTAGADFGPLGTVTASFA